MKRKNIMIWWSPWKHHKYNRVLFSSLPQETEGPEQASWYNVASSLATASYQTLFCIYYGSSLAAVKAAATLPGVWQNEGSYIILKTLQYIHKIIPNTISVCPQAHSPLPHIYNTKSMCMCVYSVYVIMCMCLCLCLCLFTVPAVP